MSVQIWLWAGKPDIDFFPKAGVSLFPPFSDCFETHPDTKAIKSNPITGLERPLGLQEAESIRISRQSANEGGKCVRFCVPAALTPRRYSWCSFLLEAEPILGP